MFWFVTCRDERVLLHIWPRKQWWTLQVPVCLCFTSWQQGGKRYIGCCMKCKWMYVQPTGFTPVVSSSLSTAWCTARHTGENILLTLLSLLNLLCFQSEQTAFTLLFVHLSYLSGLLTRSQTLRVNNLLRVELLQVTTASVFIEFIRRRKTVFTATRQLWSHEFSVKSSLTLWCETRWIHTTSLVSLPNITF